MQRLDLILSKKNLEKIVFLLGVYFESYHKNIKFVDFCGKFYLPLLQFLCSPACTSTPTCQLSSTNSDDMNSKFKKVLLG
jgi:hypothetical protein